MNALKDLLNSFELQMENHNGDISHGWLYYGDTDPKDAAAELAAMQSVIDGYAAEAKVMQAEIAEQKEVIEAARKYFKLTRNDIMDVLDPTISQYDAAYDLENAFSKYDGGTK